MEKQDEVCCHFPNGKDRSNRRCNVPANLSDNPNHQCYEINPNTVRKHVLQIQGNIFSPGHYDNDVQKEAAQRLNMLSTYHSINHFGMPHGRK